MSNIGTGCPTIPHFVGAFAEFKTELQSAPLWAYRQPFRVCVLIKLCLKTNCKRSQAQTANIIYPSVSTRISATKLMSKLGTLILIWPGADDRMSTALRVGVTDLIRAAMGSAQPARWSLTTSKCYNHHQQNGCGTSSLQQPQTGGHINNVLAQMIRRAAWHAAQSVPAGRHIY